MEMLDDEQPDQSIWNHHERLEEHFEQLKAKRANPNMERIEAEKEWQAADLEQNSLAEEWKKANGIK